MLEPLPIDAYVPRIHERVRAHGAAVVVAPPGAGKTTRVGPALAADGPLLLLQPRRVAARSLARRIAAERGWRLGREVGWHVRFERRFSADTRVLVATEGILTRRLQADPLLGQFRTIILDEFHERSLHADLGLALAREARRARDDLRVLVMSATLDAGAIADYLGGCPTIEVPGRVHPVEIDYAPHGSVTDAVRGVLSGESGHVLCFLPGAPEIRRAADELARAPLPGRPTVVLPLHGSLGPDEQDAALDPSERRKLILATNLAETSLTVAGVSDVIDTGLHKVLRRDDALGIDRLETERIPADAAAQRAGRAGRTGPGRALRLWDRRLQLKAHRVPEIRRVDLAGPLLDVLAWGGDPASFAWFDPPPADALEVASELLARLGAVADGRITETGRRLHAIPLHPRLARVLIEDGASPAAAAACAALAEGWRPGGPVETSASDALVLADRLDRAPPRVRRAAEVLRREARRSTRSAPGERPPASEASLRRALLAGYPDRVARRRQPGSTRLLLASGHGASLSRDSGVRDGEFLVALEVVAGARGPGSEALVRMASRVEPGWLEPTGIRVEHGFHEPSGSVRAVERTYYGSLVLAERRAEADPAVAERLIGEALVARGPGPDDEPLLRRLCFAEIVLDVPALLRGAAVGATRLPRVALRDLLPHATLRELERGAPETIRVPSGRQVRLEYRDDGSVHAAVKLQELFGLTETPRIGRRGAPLIFALLAPNGRPVQTTRDLHGFWERTYPEVRRELRGRYPKHPWPEDPWSAEPTARTRRRS